MHVQRFDFREFTSSSIDDSDTEASAFRKSSMLKAPQKKKLNVEPPPPPPPPEPTFTEAELKAAELKGYQRGFQEGSEDGKKQLDAEQAQLQKTMLKHTENFLQMIEPLFNEYRAMCHDLKKDITPVAMAIAKKVAGPALEDNAEEVVKDMVVKACKTMISEPKLTITVHESMGDMLAEQLETLTTELQTNNDIVILRSPDMPKSNCKVGWSYGQMERDTEILWDAVEKSTGNVNASIEKDTNKKLDEMEQKLPIKKPEDKQPQTQPATQATPQATPQADTKQEPLMKAGQPAQVPQANQAQQAVKPTPASPVTSNNAPAATQAPNSIAGQPAQPAQNMATNNNPAAMPPKQPQTAVNQPVQPGTPQTTTPQVPTPNAQASAKPPAAPQPTVPTSQPTQKPLSNPTPPTAKKE